MASPKSENSSVAGTGFPAISRSTSPGSSASACTGTTRASATVIGSVAEGEGVTVDGAPYDGATGWTHF